MSAQYGASARDFQRQYYSCFLVLHFGTNGPKQGATHNDKETSTCVLESESGTAAYRRKREMLRYNSKRTCIKNILQFSNQLNVALQQKIARKTITNNGNFHIMTIETSVTNFTIIKEKTNKTSNKAAGRSWNGMFLRHKTKRKKICFSSVWMTALR